jgi:hypothetical protein
VDILVVSALNEVAMNFPVYDSVWAYAFISHACIPKSGMVTLYV